MIKLREIPSITATYQLTTPMFLGNAFQQADPNLFALSSFKGALRFWWRALNWARCVFDARGQASDALKLLHQREASLFGIAADTQSSSAQSRLVLRVQMSGMKERKPVAPTPQDLKGVSYLMGMGLNHFRDGLLRSCLEGGSVTVTARLKPSGQSAAQDEADVASVVDAFKALGFFGSLGSRARKGFGSLAIQELTVEGKAHALDEAALKQFIAGLDAGAPSESTPLSAWTRDARVDVSLREASPLKALAAINLEMQLYRSWGLKGLVLNSYKAEQNFKEDHDDMLKAAAGEPVKTLPQRSVFGLPHNYRYSSTGDIVEIAPGKDGRRASPLLIHIHQFPGHSEACAIQTLLPAQFLPESMAVTIKTKPGGRGRGPEQKLAAKALDYQVIHRYMDRFKAQGAITLTKGQAHGR